MNRFMSAQAVETISCEDLTHDELNNVYLKVLPNMDEEMNAIYTFNDDRRQSKYSLEDYQQLWKEERSRVVHSDDKYGPGTSHYNMVRDGKCAEMLMWWTHHLSEGTQQMLTSSEGFVLPLMPDAGAVDTVDSMYAYQVSCSDCHISPDATDDHSAIEPSRTTHTVDDDRNCPVDPSTGVPSVWYQNASLQGQRLKRCDWDYDPPCRMCEGVGGLIWGDQEHQINYAKCTPLIEAKDIPAANVTSPVWPKQFTVQESTILINQISTGGRFPGADPCAAHKFQNQTETQYYDGNAPVSHIHTNGLLDTSDIWALPNGNMFIKVERVYCICVSPREGGNGSAIIGPLRYDFASDAVLIGRERIEIEFRTPYMEVVADHWTKGPHHFWIEVATNKMIRGWQPYNGLNIYYNWDTTVPDPSKFVVDKSCYTGFLHKNISCVAPPPGQ